ncbi:MAG: signal peptidase I [Candidatus Azobacteroides sp.]|nr:signal peptidase I [Candidatus Azobacteroides sp.]
MQVNAIWFWVKTIFVALVIAWFLRAFFIESYRVPACSMENTLLEGDRIFVSKTSYGIRLPMTILSIPFCHDSVCGIKAYSTWWELPYKRIFESSPKRNDVVVFNNPAKEFGVPVDKQKISISRCLALPGDTLVFKDKMVYVNGNALVQSPNVVEPYYYSKRFEERIVDELNSLKIPDRGVKHVDTLNIRLLSRYETFLLEQELSDSIAIEVLRPTYGLIVPSKGTKIKITDENYFIYLPIISAAEGKSVKYENNMLWIEGKQVDSYEFSQDYYWMLPDNRENYIEVNVTASFIPETHIIGKAECIWSKGFRKIR